MSERLAPKVVGAGEAPLWGVVGDRLRCLLDGKATGGQFALFEVHTPVGAGSPPHVHTKEDETFFVIDGEIEFWIDGKTVRAGPRMTVFGPRNVPHCFTNVGTKPAHMLMIASPAAIEGFFEETSRISPDVPPPAPFFELVARYGIQLVTPK